ncbi:restriction endonuclease [Microbispora rosea]|uniref:restriction endonuclease n=1 Tax=Microbispora rosea TaxID=58117 RepID=UPI0037AAEEA3
MATSNLRTFIAFAEEDIRSAVRLSRHLQADGFNIELAPLVRTFDSVASLENLSTSIKPSDVVMILLSPNLLDGSTHASAVTDTFVAELDRRSIDLIPALLATCDIPSPLHERRIIDLSTDYTAGIRSIKGLLTGYKVIDFSALTPRKFEELTRDFLESYGFKVRGDSYGVESYDFRADYSSTDPFGASETTRWLVEAKLYARGGRATVHTVQRLLMDVVGKRARGLLVTNGRLTSPTREYLDEYSLSMGIWIRVIEGPELRRLLVGRPNIVSKYFPPIPAK